VTPQELARAQARFPALAAVAPAERQLLAARGMVRALPAGTVYLREGESCAYIALVLQGRLRVSRSAPSGREITLYHIEPGETCILSASCLLAGAAYPAQATVVDDVEALLVPGDLFRHLVATSEPVRTFVIGHFGDRLATVMALIEEVAFRQVDRRLASWLAAEAGGRTGHVVALSHEQIADQVGTARVVVSRILESFGERRWIGQGRRRVEVLDPGALAAFGNRSD
jgi:CRP/FNR family transcriptional regulator